MARTTHVQSFLWTSDLAYLVGLIATDGNLSKDGRHISFRSSDLDLLSTFKKCLGLNVKSTQSYNNGYAVKPSYVIQFSNVNLYRWLVKIGLTPAKSYTISRLAIPAQYFPDFIRGHLDGDGSIINYIDIYARYKGKRYSNERVYIKLISASKNHILWLHQTIRKLLGICGFITTNGKRPDNKSPIWVLKFAKKDSIQLLKWIYYSPDLPALQRKKLIALNILDKDKYTKTQLKASVQ